MLDYQEKQAEFAAHIRNPDKNKVSDTSIEARRLKVYSELFFNNIESFLSSSFPVLKSLLTESLWLDLCRDFLENFQCQSPYFLEIPEEFLAYLEDAERPIYSQAPNISPFIQALAHYEWLELAVDVSEEVFKHPKGLPLAHDELDKTAVISELVVSAAYQWPVHKISSDFIPDEPNTEPTCLVVYRDRQYEVAFMEANPATLRLLALLSEDAVPAIKVVIQRLADELQQPAENIQPFVVDLLNQLHGLDIISHFE